MAGAGFKTFTVGEVLTSSDVNTYLMQQAVMKFASSGARGSAIGTATEGMVSYLDDTDAVEVYNGSAWVGLGGGGFTASTAITATDASWSIPTLADPYVKVTVVGGGGGGGGSSQPSAPGDNGNAGTASSVSDGTTTVTANGGAAGTGGGVNGNATDTPDGWDAGNGGVGATSGVGTSSTGGSGIGGQVKVAYFDTTGLTTLNIVIGAGGAGGSNWYSGGDGGDGVVIVEYRAG